VVLGVSSREKADANFTIRIDLVGVTLIYNATAGFNETVEVNRTTWSWYNATIGNDQSWTVPYTFSISSAGIWKVQFLLFKDSDLSRAYREVHLFVRVA